MNFGITGVAAITVLSYLVGQGIKLTPIPNKWIPILCGLTGGVLGVAGMNVITSFPASDPITACAIGVVSGLAATGAHQLCKQIKKEE